MNTERQEGRFQADLQLANILSALSAWTGIPAHRLMPGRSALSDIADLEAVLGARLFGQDDAIAATVRALKRRLVFPGGEGERHPLWSVLFAGSSGVGKSQLAKDLAKHFFGDINKHLTRIDLSEFREEHTVARLVGSPPGYVGHGQGGQLTNAVRRCSSGVLLLDEVEKAHPAILTTVILPLLGEGVVHDMNDGRALDATDLVVVMTTNLGVEAGPGVAGFTGDTRTPGNWSVDACRRVISQHFPAEVLGRLDDTIVFVPLSPDAVRRIWRQAREEFENRFSAGPGGHRLEMDEAAEALILSQMAEAVERQGARAVLRFFRRVVVDRCLELTQSGEAVGGCIRIEVTPESGLRYTLR